jgi:hypothetical protein
MSKKTKKAEVIKIETEQDAIKEWKRLGITSCEMQFSCGGDSMNDYSFEFSKNGKAVKSQELDDFFSNEVFRKVQFYECSDGHYVGEAGTVEITLNDDEDDFDYCKSAESEWNETFTETIVCDLTQEQIDFLKNKVLRVGGSDGNSAFYIYKKDCILSDNEIEIRGELDTILDEIAENQEFEESEGEKQDWYSWEIDTEETSLDDSKIWMRVSRSFLVYRDGEM